MTRQELVAGIQVSGVLVMRHHRANQRNFDSESLIGRQPEAATDEKISSVAASGCLPISDSESKLRWLAR